MTRRLVAIVLVALSVSGCAGSRDFFGDIGRAVSAATTSFDNPVDLRTVYAAKQAYASAGRLVVTYRRYCYARPFKALMQDAVAGPLCRERATVMAAVQAQRPRVRAAINAADKFVRENDKINAVAAISSMWQAIDDFKSLVPKVGG